MSAPRSGEIVSVGLDDHPALATHLEKMLQVAVASEVEALVSAKDWPDYEKRRGRIDGLNLAITHCQTARRALGN